MIKTVLFASCKFLYYLFECKFSLLHFSNISNKESVNKNADKKSWDKEIQKELMEHRERHEVNKEIETLKYENDLKVWKEVNRK